MNRSSFTPAIAARRLHKLGIPPILISLISTGRLYAEIDRCYEMYRAQVKALDEWEIANPINASMAPWAQQRKEWNDQGRPDPDWYELLFTYHDFTKPICETEISNDLHSYGNFKKKKRWWAKKKAAMKAAAST